MRIGIFFGGRSREREISFAGGRTVYDNLDKALFEPIPIFVDSLGHFIRLKWPFLYKGTIRDFYPPSNNQSVGSLPVYIESLEHLAPSELEEHITQVGEQVTPDQFASLFDFAFLVLHGPYGEDGTLQGLLDWYGIPYSGTGILGSAVGIDKVVQKSLVPLTQSYSPPYRVLTRHAWETTADKAKLFGEMKAAVGLPLVIKPARQGSSIGVSIVRADDLQQFITAVQQSLFMGEVTAAEWQSLTPTGQQQWLAALVDLREGIGLPVVVQGQHIHQPAALQHYLNSYFQHNSAPLLLNSPKGEEEILVESYIQGREFSCIVLETPAGKPLALPPTEMLKGDMHFDYRAKYLPGIVRKNTPIQLDTSTVNTIREACEILFQKLHCQVYARIDGFIMQDRSICLNDPNTTAGMNPSSFLFHQAAEIGLNPTQLLTFLIRSSLAARSHSHYAGPQVSALLASLDKRRVAIAQDNRPKQRIGVIMGGFSAERHISVESGRNIYEKLASSTQYHPIPIFLAGTAEAHQLFVLPINMLLKDNADDISQKLTQHPDAQQEALLANIRQQAASITQAYATHQPLQTEAITYAALAQRVDFVFIALHGRPGEDGTLQQLLEQHNIPYNGSGAASAQLTIDKFKTNQLLRTHNLLVADQQLVQKTAWEKDPEATLATIEAQLGYPCIAKPVDEGCSAAVIKIDHPDMLRAYAAATFRTAADLPTIAVDVLGITPQNDFPQKEYFLVEEYVKKGEAAHFLEITGGLLTHLDAQGDNNYEVFLPSEVLAQQSILSLEEKFLAGEGQNITPVRFHTDPLVNEQMTQKVQQDLQKVAEVLNIEGYARIDAFVKIYDTDRVETWIIEVNSLPAMTPATCIFHQCALHGYTPLDFIHAIIQYGLQKHRSN